jgi:hypothetical protein
VSTSEEEVAELLAELDDRALEVLGCGGSVVGSWWYEGAHHYWWVAKGDCAQLVQLGLAELAPGDDAANRSDLRRYNDLLRLTPKGALAQPKAIALYRTLQELKNDQEED